MRHLHLSLLLAIAALAGGCAGDAGSTPGDDCTVSMTFTPSTVIKGPDAEVRVASTVVSDLGGVRTYQWQVRKSGLPVTFADAQPDGSEITFLATEEGVYEVLLDASVQFATCHTEGSVNARVNTDTSLVRLRITPPLTVDAPVTERVIDLPTTGAYDLSAVVLDAGTQLSGSISGPSGGVPAYLRFIPPSMPDAVVEAFADAAGVFRVRLANVPYQVLIVPGGGFAPRRASWTPGGSATFSVGLGTAITGTVRAPSGAALAGAKVQLTIDGVPSTLATTAGDGSYTVQATLVANADTLVEVTPPAASGLPRLEVTSTFLLSSALDVAYAGGLVLRDLAGTQVRRGGAPVANAKVTVVGVLTNAGTVQGAAAPGFVRVAATANGAGTLPSTLVPAGVLSAVVRVTSTDLAVAAFTTTSAVPPTIDAPAMISDTTLLTDGADPLDAAQLDLIPKGALALAGAPTRYFSADGTGAVTASFASGGRYDMFLHDPAARVGAKTHLDVTSTLATSYALPPAIFVTGTLSVTGNSNKIIGASVQILCLTCTGLDRTRPIAEAASDQLGDFTLAVPEPGSL